jgi:hypothetical protein
LSPVAHGELARGSSVRRQGGVELAGWKRREGICAEESTLGDLFSTRAET